MALSIADAWSRDRGRVMSIPDTSPAKNGRDTGSIGRTESGTAGLPSGLFFIRSMNGRRGLPMHQGCRQRQRSSFVHLIRLAPADLPLVQDWNAHRDVGDTMERQEILN